MTAEAPIRFQAGDVELDGRIQVPAGATKACVVCHPHPLYGGDMNNSVVFAIAQGLGAAGVATLRFDFRGVGRSGGSHGGGIAEVDDARAALAALASASGLARVTIAGYSFGSLVALRVAEPAAMRGTGVASAISGGVISGGAAAPAFELAGVAAIAPPIAMFDASFVTRLSVPLLVLAGDHDAYCPREALDALCSGLPAGATTSVVRAADHFFVGREREVSDAVAGWMGTLTESPAR